MNQFHYLTRIVGVDVNTKNRKNAHAKSTATAEPQPSEEPAQSHFSGPLTFDDLMNMPQDPLSRESGFTSPDQRLFFQAILSQVGPGESQPGTPRPGGFTALDLWPVRGWVSPAQGAQPGANG